MEPSNEKKAKILIVDDIHKNLQVLGSILQSEGYAVEFAVEGKSAIAWIEKVEFDLVLLDVMMPGTNGYEVCRKVKLNGKNELLPVIFLTAKVDPQSIIEGFKAGAADYITKPFIKNELLARVKTHLEIKKSRDKLAYYLAEINEKRKSITSSIRYAKNIQEALLKTSETFTDIIPGHFILNLPRDIISGDFYWFCCIDDITIVAVMDCTGHGVPGALMSTLGVTLLNETVFSQNIIRPNLILDSLRSKLIRTLSQQGQDSIKDGIEGSIFSFDSKMKKFNFAGSSNSMLIVHDGKIREIKPDKVPIGYSYTKDDFQNFSLEIQSGDMVYFYSDGYVDQFGGPLSKKYLLKRFKEKLLTIHDLPLDKQWEELHREFTGWKGDNEQTDDILVLGIRF
ncbi:MAG: response regulator [Bacteroidales bacterium]